MTENPTAPTGPDGEPMLSCRDAIDRYGLPAAFYLLYRAGWTGPAAVAALRRAGVDDIDLEHAALTIVEESTTGGP